VLVLRLAWRNVWRQPRRSAVVVAAVAVGIAGVLVSMAINYGMMLQMVETAISTELGHLQIHAEGFDENPALETRLREGARAQTALLERTPGVRAFARRVRGEGLLTSPRASAGVRIVGVEPAREAEVSRVARSVTAGSYLGGAHRRVLLGERLASRLEVSVGDKVVLSVQDLAGDLTGEALRVGGLFRTPSAELDRSTVFLRLEESQALLGLGVGVSEVVVVAEEDSQIPAIRSRLLAADGGVEVRSWKELRPVLDYLVRAFDQQAVYVYLAVFVAMAFGIANVLLMAVYERVREIGVLMSVGMARRRVVAMIVAESMIITLCGLAIGFAVALAGTFALRDGIDLSRWSEGLAFFGVGARVVPILRSEDFVNPAWVAVATAAIASAWPAWRAARLRPARAVRQAS
jgi:ABC-type lipoprotein release transport system permease subunit